MEDRECQDRYTVVKYKEEVCISKVLKEMVNTEEAKRNGEMGRDEKKTAA